MGSCLEIRDGIEGRGRDHKGAQGDFGGDGDVIIFIAMMVSWVYTCIKTCQIVYFKCVVHYMSILYL